MGCIASKADINDIHRDTFHVVNIDEHGNKNFEASIRVTDTNLELYQKGKDTISWPLKSLRRYGFETEVFTFESGRRGPTGPGIYAFKCSRAQQLFNLLQSYVRQPVPDHSSQPPATAAGHSGRLNSIDIDQDRVANPDLPGQYETQISLHDDPNILPSGPHYMNVNCPTNLVIPPLNLECSMPNVPPPSLPQVGSATNTDNANLEGHEYVNVTLQSPVHTTPGLEEPFPPEIPKLPPKPVHALPPKPPAVINHQLSMSNIVVSTDSVDISIVERDSTIYEKTILSPTSQLNYAQLDLNRNESPLSPPPQSSNVNNGEMFSINNLNLSMTSRGSGSRRNTLENEGLFTSGTTTATTSDCPPQEYAVIDFDRTNALNDVAKLQSQRSLEAGVVVGVRKTRHH